MKFIAKAQERRERDANMMMHGFVKIQTAKVLCLRLQCLERIRADVLKFTTGTEGQVNRMNEICDKCLTCHWYCDDVLEECKGQEEPCHEYSPCMEKRRAGERNE